MQTLQSFDRADAVTDVLTTKTDSRSRPVITLNEAVVANDVRRRHSEAERQRRVSTLLRKRRLERRAQRAARKSRKASAAVLAQSERMR
ncbi:MAG TPA: hypothetical protein VK053_23445 [Jiangellaceae bacterium]|nr:hypothetical protein [Jiangellaceae bacterium]